MVTFKKKIVNGQLPYLISFSVKCYAGKRCPVYFRRALRQKRRAHLNRQAKSGEAAKSGEKASYGEFCRYFLYSFSLMKA